MGNATPLAVTGGAMFAVGALLGLLLRWMFGTDQRQMSRIRRGPLVTALVVGAVEHEGEEDPIYGGGGGGFAPTVSFSTADGQSVTASGQYVFAGNRRRAPATGTTLRVRYDPGDPQKIYIPGWDAAARGIRVILAVGPLLMLVGVVMIVSALATG